MPSTSVPAAPPQIRPPQQMRMPNAGNYILHTRHGVKYIEMNLNTNTLGGIQRQLQILLNVKVVKYIGKYFKYFFKFFSFPGCITI